MSDMSDRAAAEAWADRERSMGRTVDFGRLPFVSDPREDYPNVSAEPPPPPRMRMVTLEHIERLEAVVAAAETWADAWLPDMPPDGPDRVLYDTIERHWETKP